LVSKKYTAAVGWVLWEIGAKAPNHLFLFPGTVIEKNYHGFRRFSDKASSKTPKLFLQKVHENKPNTLWEIRANAPTHLIFYPELWPLVLIITIITAMFFGVSRKGEFKNTKNLLSAKISFLLAKTCFYLISYFFFHSMPCFNHIFGIFSAKGGGSSSHFKVNSPY
jgi:hypothetical protein